MEEKLVLHSVDLILSVELGLEFSLLPSIFGSIPKKKDNIEFKCTFLGKSHLSSFLISKKSFMCCL